MSQLADLEQVVAAQPMSEADRGKLLYDMLVLLNWDIEGVGNPADATVYLFGLGDNK